MKSKPNKLSPSVPALAVFVVAAYIAAQMLADIASVKIGLIGSLAVDMGTFIYPITFTLRDVVHKVLGRHNARLLIVSAGVINLGMAAYLMWAASFPSDPSWGMGTEFAVLLGPVWRIVIASILAEVASELLDTEIYHLFVTRVTRRYQWARVLISNSFSVPLDTLIFSIGAFAPIAALGGGLRWEAVWGIFIVNLLVKYGVTLISLPLIYVVPEKSRD